MNATNALTGVFGAACAGLTVIALVAQDPLASHETHGAKPRLADGPIGAIHAHVCGFHFYNGDPKRALRTEHYCSHLSEGVLQCVIYDSDKNHARLIGVEYIISETHFLQLPADEKKLWHSHRYEVMSGLLTAPDLPAPAETALMQELVSTYGKTWHLWQVDRGDKLPLGLPKLMMGFTADGQINPRLVAARDRELNRDSAMPKASRADLLTRPIAEGADGWQKGPAFQITDALLKQPPIAPQP